MRPYPQEQIFCKIASSYAFEEHSFEAFRNLLMNYTSPEKRSCIYDVLTSLKMSIQYPSNVVCQFTNLVFILPKKVKEIPKDLGSRLCRFIFEKGFL